MEKLLENIHGRGIQLTVATWMPMKRLFIKQLRLKTRKRSNKNQCHRVRVSYCSMNKAKSLNFHSLNQSFLFIAQQVRIRKFRVKIMNSFSLLLEESVSSKPLSKFLCFHLRRCLRRLLLVKNTSALIRQSYLSIAINTP